MKNESMDRVPVSSFSLKSIGYDAGAALLEVEFHTLPPHAYRGVPPQVHAALMAAVLKGSYFDVFIRKRYPCRPTPGRQGA